MNWKLTDFLLIIFDVDGTLCKPKSGGKFRRDAADWEWLPGRKELIQELRRRGIRCAIASNQGGVAFGYMPLEAIQAELHRLAKEANIPLGGVYICFNHPKASIEQYRTDDYRRKPGPGMLIEAMRDFEAEPDQTLYVGDLAEDSQAATAAGCSFLWADALNEVEI